MGRLGSPALGGGQDEELSRAVGLYSVGAVSVVEGAEEFGAEVGECGGLEEGGLGFRGAEVGGR